MTWYDIVTTETKNGYAVTSSLSKSPFLFSHDMMYVSTGKNVL